MAAQPMIAWDWTQARLDWSDRGGPRSVILSNQIGKGAAADFWVLVGMLRFPVDIYDDAGVWLWGGFLNGVEVTSNGVTEGFTLDNMYNDIRTAYSFVAPNTNIVGIRKTTAANTDTRSVATYGTKQLMDSASGLSDAAATARRDAALVHLKYPQGVLSAGSGADAVRITCKGWWDTLAWKLASWGSLTAIVYNNTAGAADQSLGAAAGNTKLMQQITVSGAAINVLDVQVFGRKVGAPADNITLAIYAADATNNPTGSALASVSLAGTGLSTSNGTLLFTLSSAVNLPIGSYCLQLSRSGANDGTNYYIWVVNPALGYAGGVFKLWNGAAWVARGTDADAIFAVDVDNNVDNVLQVYDLIATYGQFISGVVLSPSTLSGQKLPSYRNGDTDTLTELTALMDVGGPNGRRLIVNVDQNRLAIISEEPADTTMGYNIGPNMAISDSNGAPLEPAWSFRAIGSWAQLINILAATADVSHLLDASQQYITGGGLTNGVFTPEFRGTVMPGSLWNF
jgi:hypothetical protein